MMCLLIDYPDGTTIDSSHGLLARYPDTTGEAFFDGVGMVLIKDAPNQCLCNVTVEEVLDDAGEDWTTTDFGYEVRLKQNSRYPREDES